MICFLSSSELIKVTGTFKRIFNVIFSQFYLLLHYGWVSEWKWPWRCMWSFNPCPFPSAC